MRRASDVTIDVRRDIVMYHTVLCVDAARNPVAVRVTTNPLEHVFYAQIVMHKTRSHGCAVQVARYVRRRFGIEDAVQTHRAVRPVEAMIGYACTTTAQFAPDERTPGWGVFQHIAATPIGRLLDEVADGHNAARTRYVVYEVRSTSHPPLRGITHRFDALERRYLEAPPDSMAGVTMVQIGRFAKYEDALREITPLMVANDRLWTRKPPPDYVRSVLHIDRSPQPPARHEKHDILWNLDDRPAVRDYDTPCVCIGPHVYTEFQVRHVLEHGAWPPDGRSQEGRRLIVLGSPS